ncbi:MAG: superoxide dismutase [Chitinophagaceae bacterium]|nr:superoxide dismutase [Chitinophagaceae bacterium]
MSKHLSRRSFLHQSAKTGLAISLTAVAGTDIIAGCTSPKVLSAAPMVTGFDQTPLPYAYTALEPVIDAMTMEIHYSKHASAYARNAKDAAAAEKVDTNKPIEDVLMSISKYSAKMRNNAGGHYNHELFWKCMKAGGGALPDGKLSKAIVQSFGSMDAFKTQFSDAGKNRFGSGWAWLYADKDKQLKIGSTPNQDNPLMDAGELKGTPLLGLDVWEHAYYLKYQNRRADYIAEWWKVVNWDFVQQRFETL